MNVHVYLAAVVPVLIYATSDNISTVNDPYFILLSRNNDADILEVPSKYQEDKDMNILRTAKTTKNQPPPTDLMHTNRMIEIMNFMKDHIQSTYFLYEEMKRISRTHLIKDELREMVSFLERPRNSRLKAQVLEFYNAKRTSMMSNVLMKDPWRFKKNDLVINYLKDPFNYGVLT